MSLASVLLICGLVVIVVLAVIAGVLWCRVYRTIKIQRELLAQTNLAAQEQREHINTSIQILAQATQAEELSLTEASIRVAGLLDRLGVDEEVRDEFSAFYQLRSMTEHIPILESWKQLSAKKQKEFDRQRLGHEDTCRDFVMDAAKRIKGRIF